MGFTRLASLPERSRTIEWGEGAEFYPEVGVRRGEVAQGGQASGKVDYGERPRSEARGMRVFGGGVRERGGAKLTMGEVTD